MIMDTMGKKYHGIVESLNDLKAQLVKELDRVTAFCFKVGTCIKLLGLQFYPLRYNEEQRLC